MALGGKPELLILDEPTAGMSPDETARCINLVLGLREKFGLTILFVRTRYGNRLWHREPYHGHGTRRHDHSGYLQDKVRSNQAVQDAYLGGG